MPARKDTDSDAMLPLPHLAEHATLSILQNAAAGLPELKSWMEARVRKTPVSIWDINGQVLFHDWPVMRGSQALGYVRTAASAILGSPVVATELGPRPWSYEDAVKKLLPKVRKELRGANPEHRLVCYSYPKLGVMFEAPGETQRRVIYDVASFDRIPEKPERPDEEGAYAWSFYESLTDAERKRRQARFKKADALRLAAPKAVRTAIAARRTLKDIATGITFKFRRTATKLLSFCSHYAYNAARSHHCFALHGQQVNDYCAVATCQMILCYYRYYYSQDDIAPSLSYSAGGGCPPDQSPGYESLTCNHLDASFDNAPTWEKARDQIDLLRPLKSGVPGHARACAGYSYTWSIFTPGIRDKKLYIYDPWPWNADYAVAGAITWEDWDAITHTNYVTAKIDCP
jgi:hypothetical protein